MTTKTPDPSPTSTDSADPQLSVTLRAGALALWAVVGSLLTYGVVQTVLKAAALFT